MKKLFFNEKGITIVELLFSLIILSVVLVVITTTVIQSFNIFDSSIRRMSAGQLAELGQAEISSYLRTARNVTIKVSIEENPFDSWEFEGFYREIDEPVNYKIRWYNDENHNDYGILKVFIENESINIERIVLNNVSFFSIGDIEDVEAAFKVELTVNDGQNIKNKNTNVYTRNYSKDTDGGTGDEDKKNNEENDSGKNNDENDSEKN